MVKPKQSYPVINDNTLNEFKEYIEAIQSKEKERIAEASNNLRDYILDKVDKAIGKFYKNDIDLLKYGMNEMSISGRLAIYLQSEFEKLEGYYIDIEYYRLRVPKEKVRDIRSERIRCDILLHSRGHFNARVDNLLAIEIKMEISQDDGDSDLKRLAEFILPEKSDTPSNAVHSTLVGLFIRMGEDGYSLGLCTSLGYKERKVEIDNL